MVAGAVGGLGLSLAPGHGDADASAWGAFRPHRHTWRLAVWVMHASGARALPHCYHFSTFDLDYVN